MTEEERKLLLQAGTGYTPEILDMVESAQRADPWKEPVNLMFLEATKTALAMAGFGALDFLAANPRLSIGDLVERLPVPSPGSLGPGLPKWGRPRASGLGLKMAIYEEAASKGMVREIAKDLLVRKIEEEFPDGWSNEGTVSAAVKLGSWDYDLKKYIQDPAIGRCVASIAKHLTTDHPPVDGWKPQPHDDPLIDELFARCWPRTEH